MERSVLRGLSTAAALGLLLVACARPDAAAAPEPGFEAAPDFELASLDGGRVSLADFSGRVLLVEFWATWCAPCHVQREILEPLYRQHAGSGVEFLAVSLGEPEAIVREFAGRRPFPYPVLLDPNEELGEALRIFALPTVMIVDRQGRIAYLRPGISDGETLDRELRAAAAAAAPAASDRAAA